MLYRIHRIFLDFFHRPVFQKTRRFGHWICFPPQVKVGEKRPTQLGPLERANLNHSINHSSVGVKVWIHRFLISALSRNEWSLSWPGPFTLGKEPHSTLWTGPWVGLRPGIDAVEKKYHVPVGNWITISRLSSPKPISTELPGILSSPRTNKTKTLMITSLLPSAVTTCWPGNKELFAGGESQETWEMGNKLWRHSWRQCLSILYRDEKRGCTGRGLVAFQSIYSSPGEQRHPHKTQGSPRWIFPFLRPYNLMQLHKRPLYYSGTRLNAEILN
jgi:hypothetical protein